MRSIDEARRCTPLRMQPAWKSTNAKVAAAYFSMKVNCEKYRMLRVGRNRATSRRRVSNAYTRVDVNEPNMVETPRHSRARLAAAKWLPVIGVMVPK